MASAKDHANCLGASLELVIEGCTPSEYHMHAANIRDLRILSLGTLNVFP